MISRRVVDIPFKWVNSGGPRARSLRDASRMTGRARLLRGNGANRAPTTTDEVVHRDEVNGAPRYAWGDENGPLVHPASNRIEWFDEHTMEGTGRMMGGIGWVPAD